MALSFTFYQEAGFPPGVILEIRMYLDKGLPEENGKKISKPPAHQTIDAPSDGKNKEVKNEVPRSPSPSKSNEGGIAITQLNQELQQLMIEGNQDKGGQKNFSNEKNQPRQSTNRTRRNTLQQGGAP